MINLTIAEVKKLAIKHNANQLAVGSIIDFNGYGFLGAVEVNNGSSWGGWRLYGDFGIEEYQKLTALARDIGLDSPWNTTILTSTIALFLVGEKVKLEWNDLECGNKEKEVYIGNLKQIYLPRVDFNGAYRLNLKFEKDFHKKDEILLEDWVNVFESDDYGVFKDKTGKPVKVNFK